MATPVIATCGTTHKPYERLIAARDDAKRKAIDNLARYKFSNFGYYAARWVTLNAIVGDKQPNPFRSLVNLARVEREGN